MKIRLAAAAAAALAAPILLPASHALASTTHAASPAAVSHVSGGCGCGVCGGCGDFGGGFANFGGGCIKHCGCGHECGFREHVDIDVHVHPFISPCFNPCFGL